MSAEILRRAAKKVREDVMVMADETGSPPDGFLLAVADWLDACALVCEVKADAVKAHALTVARAYLGEAS